MVLYDCLIKTKHFAKTKNQCIECELCPLSAGYSILLSSLKLGIDRIPDQWRPYSEGPKVAEYPGR